MYINRAAQQSIESSLSRTCITAVLGPRRVGKTSLIKNYSQKITRGIWCTINLDSLSLRQRIANQELEQIIIEECHQNIGGKEKIWVAIDEAQKSPELFEQIKIIYDAWIDRDPEKIKFILTGSGHLSLHKLSTESLAGRIELYYLQPFTLRELCVMHGYEIETKSPLMLINTCSEEELPYKIEAVIKNILPFKNVIKNVLQEQMIWGGLPELLKYSTKAEKQIYLTNYIDTYLEQDVRAISTISDLMLFKNMMITLAQQTGSMRDDKKITDALSCNIETLKKYRGFLSATLLYIELYPFIDVTLKKLVKSPKGYLLDNGLISNLTGLYDYNALTTTGKIGSRFENWFIQELRSWLTQLPERSEIHFWRLSSGSEVDFVVSIKPNILPFEITYGEQPERKKITNLKKFMAQVPEAKWAFYIYNGKFMVDAENKIIFLPAWVI